MSPSLEYWSEEGRKSASYTEWRGAILSDGSFACKISTMAGELLGALDIRSIPGEGALSIDVSENSAVGRMNLQALGDHSSAEDLYATLGLEFRKNYKGIICTTTGGGVDSISWSFKLTLLRSLNRDETAARQYLSEINAGACACGLAKYISENLPVKFEITPFFHRNYR